MSGIHSRLRPVAFVALAVACGGDDRSGRGDGSPMADAGPLAGFGEACTRTEDCESGLCVTTGPGAAVCTRLCTSNADCPTAANWGCVAPVEIDARICGCVGDSDVEVCADGADNDCDGAVDDCRMCGGRLVPGDDPLHCGECENACPSRATCDDGECHCPASAPTACNDECVDQQREERHCGGCGIACGAGDTCIEGSCGCPSGQSVCGENCVDLQADATNCGSCGLSCSTGHVCRFGACTCPSGQSLCSGVCISTATDPLHCGACDTRCAASMSCVDGACVCSSGLTYCSGACVDTTTSVLHCGSCSSRCETGASCISGVCVCPSGTSSCGAAGCRDLSSDDDHCGACNTNCPLGTSCVSGACACSPSAAEVCNGVDDDCDTLVDEGFLCTIGASQSCTTSCGTTGFQACSSGCTWGVCVPPAEVCNGTDDDCDAVVDDGFTCAAGATGMCTTSCGTTGSRTCSSSCSWGPCTPPAEMCNGVDDDCDGLCDGGFTCCRGSTQSCTTTCGSTGSQLCGASCGWSTCVPPTETCNGADDDCDGTVDEGFACRPGSTGTCVTVCGTTGSRTCSASCGWGTCNPPAEVCNGVDDDCDGVVDEGLTCAA